MTRHTLQCGLGILSVLAAGAIQVWLLAQPAGSRRGVARASLSRDARRTASRGDAGDRGEGQAAV